VEDLVVDAAGELERGEAEVGGDEEEADEGACWSCELGSALYALVWSGGIAEGEGGGGIAYPQRGV